MPRRKSSRTKAKSSTRKPLDMIKLSHAWRRAKNKSESNASPETKVRALRTPHNLTFEKRNGISRKKSGKKSDSDTSDFEQ